MPQSSVPPTSSVPANGGWVWYSEELGTLQTNGGWVWYSEELGTLQTNGGWVWYSEELGTLQTNGGEGVVYQVFEEFSLGSLLLQSMLKIT